MPKGLGHNYARLHSNEKLDDTYKTEARYVGA